MSWVKSMPALRVMSRNVGCPAAIAVARTIGIDSSGTIRRMRTFYNAVAGGQPAERAVRTHHGPHGERQGEDDGRSGSRPSRLRPWPPCPDDPVRERALEERRA